MYYALGNITGKRGKEGEEKKLGEGEGEGDEENEELEDEEEFGDNDYAQVHANFCAFVTISTYVQNITLFLKYCWSLHSCSPKLWLWVRFSLKRVSMIDSFQTGARTQLVEQKISVGICDKTLDLMMMMNTWMLMTMVMMVYFLEP